MTRAKVSQYIIVVLVVLLVNFFSYNLGRKTINAPHQASLDAVQAMLAFNHLLQYEELSDCLSKGNSEQVAWKLEMAIISAKERIAEFLTMHNDPMVTKYISIRYPQGIKSLKNFKSNRGSNWSDPRCK